MALIYLLLAVLLFFLILISNVIIAVIIVAIAVLVVLVPVFLILFLLNIRRWLPLWGPGQELRRRPFRHFLVFSLGFRPIIIFQA